MNVGRQSYQLFSSELATEFALQARDSPGWQTPVLEIKRIQCSCSFSEPVFGLVHSVYSHDQNVTLPEVRKSIEVDGVSPCCSKALAERVVIGWNEKEFKLGDLCPMLVVDIIGPFAGETLQMIHEVQIEWRMKFL